MAEQFLTLMGDLDEDAQERLSGWYGRLRNAGFLGTQTPGLPYHISLAMIPLEREREAAALTERVAGTFAAVPVNVSHLGIFPGGKVLFGGIERNAALDALHDACVMEPDPRWTPHISILIDEPAVICRAVPVLLESFQPFTGHITRLHLCAFWPTREITAAGLGTLKEE